MGKSSCELTNDDFLGKCLFCWGVCKNSIGLTLRCSIALWCNLSASDNLVDLPVLILCGEQPGS